MPKDTYFDSGLRGWLRLTANEEHWRVAGWMTADDLYQEGFVCYCKCRDRYTLGPPKPGFQNLFTDTPNEAQRRHFMSLLQRAFYNKIYTLAQQYPAAREVPISNVSIDDTDEPVTFEELIPAEPEGATALIAVLHAPSEIAEAIAKLVQDSIDGGKYLKSRLVRLPSGRVRIGRVAIRETNRERHARILGDPTLTDKVSSYLDSGWAPERRLIRAHKW